MSIHLRRHPHQIKRRKQLLIWSVAGKVTLLTPVVFQRAPFAAILLPTLARIDATPCRSRREGVYCALVSTI